MSIAELDDLLDDLEKSVDQKAQDGSESFFASLSQFEVRIKYY